MLRSIHAECYKVFHRLYFQVSALLCALFAGGMVFCLYLIKTEAGGETIITMPFAVATTGVEGLKTIVPVAGISDWYSQQNMQGAQRYWPKEMLNSFLAYYCSSRYNDSTLSEKQLDDIAAFHHELSLRQLKCGFDYDEDFWGSGNYRLHADRIRCSALIVQGLNDENVSTKQFEMMLKAFQQSGQTVKAILHQGPHITPTMPNKNYGILINGRF